MTKEIKGNKSTSQHQRVLDIQLKRQVTQDNNLKMMLYQIT